MPRRNTDRPRTSKDYSTRHRNAIPRNQREAEARERALAALARMRREGRSLREAATAEGTSPTTIKRYVGSALRREPGKGYRRPFTAVTVPFPKKEAGLLWTGFFIMPYAEKLDDLHGRPMVNIMSGATFYVYDKYSSRLAKPSGWLSLKTMEDEIDHILSRAESKFCTPNGSTCTGKTVGLLVRRHVVANEFHYIGREASTRWGSGPDLSMLAEAGALDPTHETFREYERVVDAKYLEEIRAEAKQFSTKLLSRKSGAAKCAIRHFKNGKNTIKPRTLRKLTMAIHELQNRKTKN